LFTCSYVFTENQSLISALGVVSTDLHRSRRVFSWSGSSRRTS
jgi:hypothetical protein